MPLFNFLLACILYGLSFVTSSPVKAEQPFECSLESIASELGEQAMLNEFVQTKQVTILKKPLISKG